MSESSPSSQTPTNNIPEHLSHEQMLLLQTAHFPSTGGAGVVTAEGQQECQASRMMPFSMYDLPMDAVHGAAASTTSSILPDSMPGALAPHLMMGTGTNTSSAIYTNPASPWFTDTSASSNTSFLASPFHSQSTRTVDSYVQAQCAMFRSPAGALTFGGTPVRGASDLVQGGPAQFPQVLNGAFGHEVGNVVGVMSTNVREEMEATYEARLKAQDERLRMQEEAMKAQAVRMKELEGSVNAGGVKRRGKTGAKPRISTDVINAVHDAMLHLIGVENTSRRASKLRVYPEPLQHGDVPRLADDGSRLYNPDWNLPVNGGINEEWVSAAVHLVMQNGEVNYKLDMSSVQEEDVYASAATFFRSLKEDYRARHSEMKEAKVAKKRKRDKLTQRKKRKADDRRQACNHLEKSHGAESTVGVRFLVHTDWMSSEHSTDGDASHSEWDNARKAQGAGRAAWEVRKLLWRSPFLNRVYARLDHLLATEPILSTAGVQGEEQVIQGTSTSTPVISGVQRNDRFRGPVANYNVDGPRKRRKEKKIIYKECISTAWANRTGDNAHLLQRAPDRPPEYSIFSLSIPNSDLNQDDVDLGWMADDEDEADVEN
ncbi:hypothetical protein BKA93DRAFT_823380 [Sparassis latifolia]